MVSLVAVLVVLSAIHLLQGTAGLSVSELLRAAVDPTGERAILLGSRLPRLLSGLLVGAALGMAGTGMQAIARNPLASPDTLAVNAGAYFLVVLAAAFGLSLPTLPAGGLAFLGGLAAAALVLLLGGRSSTTRLILAGSAMAMLLGSVTALLMLLFSQQTAGLFAWGSGSLNQIDLVSVRQMAPVIAVAAALLILLARRLDLLGLGDDTAALLGLRVTRVRITTLLLTVLLAAAAVTLAGPIGFVGLCAPVIVRMLATRVPGLTRHLILLPLSAVTGAAIVIGADVVLRAPFGAVAASAIPTGVITTVVGAALLVFLARRYTDETSVGGIPGSARAAARGSATNLVILVGGVGVLAGAMTAGMLLGDTMVLLGDLANWWSGQTGPAMTFVLDQRLPRVLGAVFAGAALAVAGTSVQATCRNPLAEPGLLGITAGAGLAAVAVITLAPDAGAMALMLAAAGGAAGGFALVFVLARGGGLNSSRLVLVGVGLSAGLGGLTTLLVVATNPWDTPRALTWLSGSTYGRTMAMVAPVALALALIAPLVLADHRRLDLLALDDDTPRVLGVRLDRTRVLHLSGAAILTAGAVCAVGVVGFVGLVAPHCARSLVGGRHRRVIPLAAVLGAALVSVADTLGRTVIAPAQIPAGLVTAIVGAPYFVYLLWRTRD